MIDFIIFILAFLGSIVVGKDVLIPLLDAIIFSIGYTFFFLWQLNLKKVLKNPLLTTKLFIQLALKGFLIRCDWGEVQEIKKGKRIWKPYFHYEGFD